MKDYAKGRSPDMLEPFFPNEPFRHAIVSCFLIIVELVAVMVLPLPWRVGGRPDYVPWFFMPIYGLRRLIHNEPLFITFLVVCAILFVSWPFLVVRKKRHTVLSGSDGNAGNGAKECGDLWKRPVLFAIVVAALLSIITLCFIPV